MTTATMERRRIEVVQGNGAEHQLHNLLCNACSPTIATEWQATCLLIAVGLWLLIGGDARSSAAWAMHLEIAPMWAWGSGYWAVGVAHATSLLRQWTRARMICAHIECALWCLAAASFFTHQWFAVALMVSIFSASAGWVILRLKAARRYA